MGLPRIVQLAELEPASREALCRRFHREIYLPAFPDPNLREEPETWLRLLEGEPPPSPKLHLLLAVEGASEIAGGVVAELYRRSGSGLVTYLVVAPGWRRRGVARLLLGAALAALRRDAEDGSPCVFAEAAVDQQRGEDLPARLAALRRLGFLACRFPYVQPPLSAGQAAFEGCLLLVHASCVAPGAALPARRLTAFLDEFYEALLGPTEWRRHPGLLGMRKWLAGRRDVAVVRLDEQSALERGG